MLPILTVDEMLAVDERTRVERKISDWDLMHEVTDALVENLHFLQNFSRGSVLVLCGPGNNGGDGYQLAEKLRKKGFKISVWSVLEPRASTCRQAARFCKAKRVTAVPADCDVIIDAIFGIQGRSTLDTKVSRVLKMANQKKAIRLSIDIPTGIDARRQNIHRETFLADATLTIGFSKDCFLSEKICAYAGSIFVVRACFVSPRIKKSRGLFIEDHDFAFQKISPVTYKSAMGRAGIVGGATGQWGAALLAAEAASRAGSGYTSLFLAQKLNHLKIKIADAGFLWKSPWTPKDLMKESALVVGPGGYPSGSGFQKILRTKSCVFDAEALHKIKRVDINENSILTPHVGEAARMLGTSSEKILKNRESAVRELSDQYRTNVYLKGAPGLLKFLGDSQIYSPLTVNPIFAKAGSGDILSGIIGGFLAQKPHDIRSAVISGLLLQRNIGIALWGRRGLTVTDQLNVFPEAFQRLTRKSA